MYYIICKLDVPGFHNWPDAPAGRMNLIGMMIGQYLLKACLALADTPFFYFFTRREVTEHGNEYQENLELLKKSTAILKSPTPT